MLNSQSPVRVEAEPHLSWLFCAGAPSCQRRKSGNWSCEFCPVDGLSRAQTVVAVVMIAGGPASQHFADIQLATICQLATLRRRTWDAPTGSGRG